MPFDGSVWTPTLFPLQPARSARRDDDQRLASMLLEGGIWPAAIYAVPADENVEDYVLSEDGGWVEEWGRPLRRWAGFPSQSHSTQAKRALFYTAFAAQRGIDRVYQIRVAAPVCSIPLTALRRAHAETSRRVMDRLRYWLERNTSRLRVDMIAAEVVRDGKDCVYLHFHLITRVGTHAELATLRRFWTTTRSGLPTGWDWWDSSMDADDEEEESRTERHPAALVHYVAKGLAAALDDDWTPEELAEVWRQTRGVAMVRATGEFRRWLGDLERAGLTVRRGDYGAAIVVPKRPQRLRIRRHREKLFQSVGFSVLHRLEEYDFGDGVRRRAWLVRGYSGLTMGDIASVYDLGDTHFTGYASIPESEPIAATGQTNGERDPVPVDIGDSPG